MFVCLMSGELYFFILDVFIFQLQIKINFMLPWSASSPGHVAHQAGLEGVKLKWSRSRCVRQDLG